MSGTSLDGIDAVITDFSENKVRLLCSHYIAYPKKVRQKLQRICSQQSSSPQELAEMDSILGKLYADSVLLLLQKANIQKENVRAIGNHGQTVAHHPQQPNPYSLQIGDPNIITELTHIPVVADFRRKDIAAGGQGAPLVPAFHQAIFRSASEDRAIINIGGIANITYLPSTQSEKIIGFDCGPGNTLMDLWVESHLGETYDQNGDWARSGKINDPLLKIFLDDPYFSLPTPKSTGTDYFSPQWLRNKLDIFNRELADEDIQSTLTELTAQTICAALQGVSSKSVQLYTCGGGAQNSYLMERIAVLSGKATETTQRIGTSPDWVEAIAFAWLARQTINGQTSNLPEVTGASRPVILGAIYSP
jgi:anhydro-N-acetylmuramic acid kinase